MLGVDSGAPGFRKVIIRPHPGKLTRLAGEVPHPLGMVGVKGEKKGSQWTFEATLPDGVSGVFWWQGERKELRLGGNRVSVRAD